MEKKEIKTVGKEVTKAVETMKKAGEKAPVAAPKKNEATDLQKEIDRKTEELQKCLAELERKKKLSYNRTAFMQALEKLEQAEGTLNEEDTFETKSYRLHFENTTSYHNEDIFAISNRFVLTEFIGFMRGKILLKIADIEKQLITE